ncbi:DUF72 domain-containing protein [Pseudomonas abieticivorans]|uniref:DUF72 domain-containing protein n=1 Tax=Pseudomonas abieticivorans TaxID=2931382 RepID=UPI0020BF1466|nr:DUF72 domain-containing protein [Pseudomonas sp. PIA16]
MNHVHIGMSGWRYAPWRGDFYPEGLTHKDELKFASRAVGSIEINGSFYALQTPDRYAHWYADTPKGFIFSVKGPRFITHVKRLREVETPLSNFFASGVFQLREKLGPILWQFPPSFKFDPALFEHFLSLLPHTCKAALACAKGCDARMRKPGYLDLGKARGTLRHAVEIRHESFAVPEFIALLRRYKVALVMADTAGKWPYAEDLTADFIYMRLHGDAELYASGYTPKALKHWQARIECWQQGGQPEDAVLIERKTPRKRAGREVYCYFDNDLKVRAPYDARQLIDALGVEDTLTERPGEGPTGVSDFV